jgi:ABC-2 type transport system ATP-binding protein
MIETKYIQQIEEALITTDYSLLTRRCLDICRDYTVDKVIETQAFELRKQFLQSSNNTILNEVDFIEKAKTLINLIKNSTVTLKNNQALNTTVVFKAHEVSKQFYKGKSPFKLYPVSFELHLGEITGVVGENGNGKTTLLRMVAGLLSINSGSIEYPALNNTGTNYYDAKNKFAFIPQRIPKWHGTLMENLMFFATIHHIKGEENYRQIEYILFRLGLDKFRDLTWNEISSGYRMRFELAKMLLWRPHLLILDEPLANLDINAQQLFLQDLKFFSQSYSYPLSIIFSSQQLHEVERVADNIIFIRQGKTIYNGKQTEFGVNREVNNFEVAGNFSLHDLQACLQSLPNCKIEDAGTALIISVSKENQWFNVMELIHKHQLQLNYFRDISQSTRQLFHKDI